MEVNQIVNEETVKVNSVPAVKKTPAQIVGILVILIQYLLLYFSSSINLLTNYNYPFMLVINSLSSFLIFNRFSYFFHLFN